MGVDDRNVVGVVDLQILRASDTILRRASLRSLVVPCLLHSWWPKSARLCYEHGMEARKRVLQVCDKRWVHVTNVRLAWRAYSRCREPSSSISSVVASFVRAEEGR